MSDARQHDLGAMFHVLNRAMIDAETPLLDRAGISMWEYTVLVALAGGPAARQADLARRTGRDPTRLIGHLDALQDRGLIQRAPDPVDRRSHVISLTTAGRRVLRSCRTSIRRMEDRHLAVLPELDRGAFLRALDQLTRVYRRTD